MISLLAVVSGSKGPSVDFLPSVAATAELSVNFDARSTDDIAPGLARRLGAATVCAQGSHSAHLSTQCH